LFSVVIPLYNKSPHIKKAIDSVLAQSYDNFELIVVDDGSTDGGADIVSQIADPRIHLVHQKNAGVSAARNKGIELAQSDYIAFLDADDYWMPDHLETIKQLIEIYPDCGMYATSYRIRDKNGNLTQKPKINKPLGWHIKLDLDKYLELNTDQTYFWTGAICVWKRMFSQAGYFEVGLNTGQDLDMWLRIATHAPVAFINENTAIYNTGAVNPSTYRWSPEVGVDFLRLTKLIHNTNINDITKNHLYEYYSRRMIVRGRIALINGYEKEALECIKKSYKTKKNRIPLIKLITMYFLSLLGFDSFVRKRR
jgi:glycosyltransferase involved in cell wall biosynthesis